MNAQEAKEKTTILVVEDDVEIAWMISSLLEREGYSAVVAQSGEEALDMLEPGEAAPPEPLVRADLILLDVLMRGLDGYQVCQRLKRDERLGYIPVIMVTVLDSLSEKVKGLEYGADDYIAKPFKSEELLARIRALLRVKRLYDELKRAEEEIRRRTAQLEALRQVGLEITTELDLDTLLHSIVSRAMGLVGGTAGGLYMYRPDLDVLVWVVAAGLHLAPAGTILHRGEELSGKVWETGEPIIVDDYQQWEGQETSYVGYPFRAIVAAPVHWGGKFLGVLNVFADTPHTFSPADAELLSLFATQAAIAIGNASFFEAEQEERELAEALGEAAAVISSTLDPGQVLDRILEQVSRVVPNDATNIMLIEGDQARIVRWRGYERFGAEEYVSTVVFRIPEAPSFQQILDSGEPMVIPDTTAYPVWVRVPMTEWSRSYAAAPIIVRGEVIGFLNVDSAIPGFFTQADVEALRAFAHHAATAIENARLYEAAQQEIAERKQMEDKLLGAARQWRTTFDGIRDAVCLLSLEGNVLRCNMAMKNLLGKPFNEIIGRPCWELVHGTSDPIEGCPRVRMRETRRRETLVLPMGDRWWDISVDPVLDEDGDLVGAAHIIADITERKRAEETIKQMAYHDALTGLPNRRLFNDRLNMALAHAHRSQQKLAVMLLDLDHFKDVNDTLGHSVGDQLLQIAGERLTGLLRKGDSVARMGGDEFMLLLPEIAGGEDPARIAQKILEAFRKPFVLDGHEFHVTTSIGISLYPEDGEDADTLMKNADIAMYRAKDLGRDNYQRYTPAMTAKALA